MRIVADLHLHSKYSRAVSKDMEIPEMSRQAKRRGIDLLATGDWTHPLWLHHLEIELNESSAGSGIFQSQKNPDGAQFLLSTEISCIFTQAGKVRRIHLLIFAPSFETVHKINESLLQHHCNLHADGRPIVGLSCIQIAEIVFGADPRCLIIPAHAWTPWFGLYGSRGGFDRLTDAFGEYADRIFAIETGLSSDPAMNWQIAELEKRSIVSFSDAHSPAKMGRELTVLELNSFKYQSLYDAISARSTKKKTKNKILFTVEFYPEEGKYHWDGHRDCGVVQSPLITKEKGDRCPVCGRPLTIGVEYRVNELASMPVTPENILQKPDKNGVVFYYHPTDQTRPSFVKLVPLQEIIAEVDKKTVHAKSVQQKYDAFINHFGDELKILTEVELEKLIATCGLQIATAIDQVRRGNVSIQPGYDGVYGHVTIPLAAHTVPQNVHQDSLF